ncbi:7333_t:CDS:1, partial [Cetraspora pellucida]
MLSNKQKSKTPVSFLSYTSKRQESSGSSSAYIFNQNTLNETHVGGRGLSP